MELKDPSGGKTYKVEEVHGPPFSLIRRLQTQRLHILARCHYMRRLPIRLETSRGRRAWPLAACTT